RGASGETDPPGTDVSDRPKRDPHGSQLVQPHHLRRALALAAGAALSLPMLSGTAYASAPSTSPSDAKYTCSDSHNIDPGHGANNTGGYQSTCNPADFGGNGQEFGPGLQTGKPCSGCVGNADDK